MKPRDTILIVDDEKMNILVLDAALQDEYELVVARNGLEALDYARSDPPPSLILLDIRMPVMDGYEACHRLRADPRTRNIPVIFVTAMSSAEDETKGLTLGAVDYITKPIRPAIVRARVRTHVQLARAYKELEAKNKQLAELARIDGLTGLLNRRFLMQRLGEELGRAKREAQPLSLMLMDLDWFKKVNDQYGHSAGDKVLFHSARLIDQSLRGFDIAGRYGGEEFLAVLPNSNLEEAAKAAERLRGLLEHTPVTLDSGQQVSVTCSIGVSEWDRQETDMSLIDRADQALYWAKGHGRNRVGTHPAKAKDGNSNLAHRSSV